MQQLLRTVQGPRWILMGAIILFFVSVALFSHSSLYRYAAPSVLTHSQARGIKSPNLVKPVLEEDAVAADAVLVQVINSALFTPASPDPAGIAYLSDSNTFLIADSEVDETTGAGFHDVNLWEITPTGTVVAVGNTLDWPPIDTIMEPTGLSYDVATGTLFVSNDDTRRIYVVKRGVDGVFGTVDDIISQINTANIIQTPNSDTEDPAFDPATGHLFFLNGQETQVYRLDPVNGIFGDGDDTFTYFDFGSPTATDAEGLSINVANGTLMIGTNGRRILEFTKDGTLIRTIQANTITGLQSISGLAMAPASDGSGNINFWVVDRGVDNDTDPTENDGEIFELTLPNAAPFIASVTIDNLQPKTNEALTAAALAYDDNGDPFTLAYQWLRNGIPIPGATDSTLDLSIAGHGDKGDWISVRVIASDVNGDSVPVTASVRIVNTPPVLSLPDRTNIELQSIDLALATTDADGDVLTYTATGLPPGLTLNPLTGQVTGTIAAGAGVASPYNVQFSVSEDASLPPAPITLVQRVTPGAPSASVVTTTFPSIPTEGNLLVAIIRVGSGRVPTLPEGWTEVGRGTGTPLAWVFYKFAGPSEPQSVEMTVSGAATNANLSLFEYSGLIPAPDQILGGFVTSGPVGGTPGVLSMTTGSLTVTTENELLLAAIHLGGSRAWDNAWTNGFTRLNTQLPSVLLHQSIAALITGPGTYSTTESWITDGRPGSAATTLASFRGLTPLPDPDPVTDNFLWYVRLVPTAATVSVAGRVESPLGRGIANVIVVAFSMEGESWSARSNTFGYFKIGGLPAGRPYVVTAYSRRYEFESQLLSLDDDVMGLVIRSNRLD